MKAQKDIRAAKLTAAEIAASNAAYKARIAESQAIKSAEWAVHKAKQALEPVIAQTYFEGAQAITSEQRAADGAAEDSALAALATEARARRADPTGAADHDHDESAA